MAVLSVIGVLFVFSPLSTLIIRCALEASKRTLLAVAKEVLCLNFFIRTGILPAARNLALLTFTPKVLGVLATNGRGDGTGFSS